MGKKEIRREAPKKFLAYIYSRWIDEIETFLKNSGKNSVRNFEQNFPKKLFFPGRIPPQGNKLGSIFSKMIFQDRKMGFLQNQYTICIYVAQALKSYNHRRFSELHCIFSKKIKIQQILISIHLDFKF